MIWPADCGSSPTFNFLNKGAKVFLCSLSFYEGGIGMMLTYSEIISTIVLVVSVARLVLDIVKYFNETKKK